MVKVVVAAAAAATYSAPCKHAAVVLQLCKIATKKTFKKNLRISCVQQKKSSKVCKKKVDVCRVVLKSSMTKQLMYLDPKLIENILICANIIQFSSCINSNHLYRTKRK